ncbi:MAG: hypothetical protein LBU36_03085 [Clostridiales bacterium]|jgi:hypothetical protein|nr:hypothetical protein [Clostridiales bacterium]
MGEPDRREILVMTALALHERDLEKLNPTDYFLHDYIYTRNSKARLSSAAGCVVIMFLYALSVALDESAEIPSFNELGAWFWRAVGVVLVYTIISGVKAYLEYEKAQEKRERYERLLVRLISLRRERKERE